MSGILQALLAGFGGAATDQYFKYVTMLLPGNGTNGAQNNTFLDSSTNNFTITRNGNTTQGTFSPFGNNWSNYFDGTGDYLTVADSATLEPGSSDFTFECWVFPTATGSYLGVFSKRATNGVYGPIQVLINNGTMEMAASTSGSSWAVVATASSSPALNTWSHIAVVRNGTASNNLVLYLNGVSVATGSVSNTALFDNSGAWAIGADSAAGTGAFAGYISNFRYVKGSAVYTAAFTPPTAPLTAITNTSLLTCQSNRFIDNSTNAFTITRNGDVSVQRLSPFNPTAPYAAGTDGGSGYFDGSGDYLKPTVATPSEIGTGDFSISFWVYATTADPSSQIIADTAYNGGGFSNGWVFQINSATGFSFYIGGASSGNALTASGVNLRNSWNYIEVSRSGSTGYLFVNGALITSATRAQNGSSGLTAAIGSQQNGGSTVNSPYFAGYIADFRIIKSVGNTTAYTPPTAPLTAITNTSLLLSMTNAGIIDNAEMNNLETVGNAQISTAQSKFGGASMLFDGTGDYLVRPDAEFLRLSSGDFTIEAWVYLTGNQPQFDGGVASYGATTTSAGWTVAISGSSAGGTLNRLLYGVNASASGGAPLYGVNGIALNTWTHIAVTKSGTTVRLFINGSLDNSGTVTATPTTSTSYFFYVGTQAYDPTATTRQFAGYIDDLRITKGYARYTANFSVPTAPFPLS